MPPKSRTSTSSVGGAAKPTQRASATRAVNKSETKKKIPAAKKKRPSTETAAKNAAAGKSGKASSSKKAAVKSSAATKKKAPARKGTTSGKVEKKKKPSSSSKKKISGVEAGAKKTKKAAPKKYRVKRSQLGVPEPHHVYRPLTSGMHLSHHHLEAATGGGGGEVKKPKNGSDDDAGASSSVCTESTTTESLLSSVEHEEEALAHQFTIKGFNPIDPVVMVDYVPLTSDEHKMLGPLFHRGVNNYYWQFCDADQQHRPDIRPIASYENITDDDEGASFDNALFYNNYPLELSRALEFAYAAYLISPSGGQRTIKTREQTLVVDFDAMMHKSTVDPPGVVRGEGEVKEDDSMPVGFEVEVVTQENATQLPMTSLGMPRAVAEEDEQSSTSASPNMSFANAPSVNEEDEAPPRARVSQILRHAPLLLPVVEGDMDGATEEAEVGGGGRTSALSTFSTAAVSSRASTSRVSATAASLKELRDEKEGDDIVLTQDHGKHTFYPCRHLNRMYRL